MFKYPAFTTHFSLSPVPILLHPGLQVGCLLATDKPNQITQGNFVRQD